MNKEKNKEEVSIIISYNTEKNNPELNYLIKAFGEEEVKAIMVPDQIRLELKFDKPKELHVVFQFIKGFIDSLITKHPTKVHRDIIIAALEENKIQYNNSIVDLISRELIAKCRILHLKLKTPSYLQYLIDNDKKNEETFSKESGRQPLPLEVKRYTLSPELESAFEDDGIFIWDKALLETTGETGKYGKQLSGEYTKSFQKIVKKYQEEQTAVLAHWFDINSSSPEEPFYIAETLKALVVCIYKDVVEKNINFEKKNLPATGINIHHTLLKTFKGTTFLDEKDQVKIIHQGTQIACTIPTISQELINTVFKGASKLNTVIGHRCLRHLIKKPFEQIIAGQKDFRVLCYERGIKELAEEIGLKNNRRSCTDLNQIINALAYLEFSFPSSTGNLIQLTKHRSKITHRFEHCTIIVGLQLLPYWVNNNEKGSDKLLIPLMQDPPLVKPTQYYAHQYMLQMEIMEEFSNQSEMLKKEGAIYLPTSKWEQLGNQCSLKQNVLKKVKDKWTQDGDDGAQFLKPVDKDFYTLGTEHNKALAFLENQGQIKITNKKRGEKGAKIKALGG